MYQGRLGHGMMGGDNMYEDCLDTLVMLNSERDWVTIYDLGDLYGTLNCMQ